MDPCWPLPTVPQTRGGLRVPAGREDETSFVSGRGGTPRCPDVESAGSTRSHGRHFPPDEVPADTRKGRSGIPSERLLFTYPDGGKEWRAPPVVPEVGETLVRRNQEWVVDTVETEHDGVTIVVLRDANRAPGDGAPEG
jgi:hypothetical protein